MVDASNGSIGGRRPGDVAPVGTPGTEETVCQECQGAGELMGKPCIACNGTGVVVRETMEGEKPLSPLP